MFQYSNLSGMICTVTHAPCNSHNSAVRKLRHYFVYALSPQIHYFNSRKSEDVVLLLSKRVERRRVASAVALIHVPHARAGARHRSIYDPLMI